MNKNSKQEISKGKSPKSTRSANNSNQDNRCDVCHKTFSTRTNLTRHKITHEGRKPYVCNICGNAFTQNGSLKSHMVNGSHFFRFYSKKKWKISSDNCVMHWKIFVFFQYIHTGVRPYQCKDCGKAFTQSKSLVFHMRRRKLFMLCKMGIFPNHLTFVSISRHGWETIPLSILCRQIPTKGWAKATRSR